MCDVNARMVRRLARHMDILITKVPVSHCVLHKLFKIKIIFQVNVPF